jgi:hypothetical protein
MPGMAYYVVLENMGGDRFVEHVGLVLPNSIVRLAGGYTFPVYDWPVDPRAGERDTATLARIFSTQVEYAEYKRYEYVGIIFGWAQDGLSDAARGLLPLVCDRARTAIETALRTYQGAGGIHSMLYMLHPAMDRDYCPNPRNPLERCFRGSCVGFVEMCYLACGTQLVDAASAPVIQSREHLRALPVGEYFLRLEEKAGGGENAHSLFGEDFPLRLLFPGYQLAALAQDKFYPFVPSLADAKC